MLCALCSVLCALSVRSLPNMGESSASEEDDLADLYDPSPRDGGGEDDVLGILGVESTTESKPIMPKVCTLLPLPLYARTRTRTHAHTH